MTYKDLFRKFKVNEGEQATYEKMIDAFLQYVNERFEWDLEFVSDSIEHDWLLDYTTDDGRSFLHYYDPDEIELVVTPDGDVLDTDDEESRDYTKFVY